jgi:hypothetical protein
MAGTWNIKDKAGFARIIGSWQKTMVENGITYRVKLSLKPDGALTWEMIDPMPGHSNSSVSFTATENTIIIYKDPDCDGNGYYGYTANDTSINITMTKDKCPPRAPSFSGNWKKIKP